MARPALNRDTTVCISLSGRPSNHGIKFHNYLYEKHGLDYLYKAMTTTDIEGATPACVLWVFVAARCLCRSSSCYPLMDDMDHSVCGYWCGEHDCEH